MTCWIWIESGAVVDADTHELGVALLQASFPHCVVRAEDAPATVELVQLLAPLV